jgi:hypothetical protein
MAIKKMIGEVLSDLGFVNRSQLEQALDMGIREMAFKPLSSATFSRIVRNVLDS